MPDFPPLEDYANAGVNLEGLDDELRERLTYALAHELIQCRIDSAVRSLDAQRWLYDRWVAYCRDKAAWIAAHPGEAVPNLAAVPGTSAHERGLAVDLECVGFVNWLLVGLIFKYYGLWQPVRDRDGNVIEGWHFQLDPERGPIEELRMRLGVSPGGPLEPEQVFVDPPQTGGAPPPIPEDEDEDDDVKPLCRILGPFAGDAQFIRFSNGEVKHLGPAEMALYDEGGPLMGLPTVTETEEASYQRLIRASGTEWHR